METVSHESRLNVMFMCIVHVQCCNLDFEKHARIVDR